MSAVRPILMIPIARLLRMRRGRLTLIGWMLFIVIAALHSRSTGQIGPASHLLRGAFGYLVLPLLVFGIVSAGLGGGGLIGSIRGVVSLGADRRRAAAGTVASLVGASALASALVGALACALAHGPGDPPLASDLVATFGVTLLGGATYAAYFCAGSSVGKGALRSVLLVLDWVLGAPRGLGSVLVPRGHLMSLLGDRPSFELSTRASSVALLVLVFVYGVLAIRLGRRRDG